MTAAIIDIGTNTINLVVFRKEADASTTILHRGMLPGRLGQGGINKNLIVPEAIERGISIIHTHKQTAEELGACHIVAFATSAVREAQNGAVFAERVLHETGIPVEVISGDREAELIYQGVKLALPLTAENVLILDIGGGSNEFIIANNQQIFWKQSFKLGITRLLAQFNPAAPIGAQTIERVNTYLHTELKDLFDALKEYPTTTLIGCAGSFSTLTRVIKHRYYPEQVDEYSELFEYQLDQLQEQYTLLINSTTEAIAETPGMDAVRVDTIGLASVFIDFVIRQCGIERVIRSGYALKEGAIQDVAQNL